MDEYICDEMFSSFSIDSYFFKIREMAICIANFLFLVAYATKNYKSYILDIVNVQMI